MFGLSGGEIALVGIAALVFLGPKKLPELARSLGSAFREFKKAKNEFTESIQILPHEEIKPKPIVAPSEAQTPPPPLHSNIPPVAATSANETQ